MRVLIAGGGTGGHVYPGIALAEELRTRGCEIVFVGTENGLESRAVPLAGFDLRFIEASGLKRVGIRRMLAGLARLPRSFAQARNIISGFLPDVAVGVGGYASGPVVLTGRLMGVPAAVLEQNSIPGITNRILGRFVQKVFGTFQSSARYFPKGKFVRAGNPIRTDLICRGSGRGAAVVILGGSLGAHALNTVVPEALRVAFARLGPKPVIHQTGHQDLANTLSAYQQAGIAADVRAFIDDMASVYAQARLCICRAGATTCAELTALGKPAVLIPFPFAADDHQTCNAQELCNAGAAVMMTQSSASAVALGALIAELLGDEERLDRMALASLRMGRPGAAQEIADALGNLAGGHARVTLEVRP
jgi:UDP-N-acetylglucosamine--N-acetylmuramyl-(pentapeptide) pyrophosphoryl-undecaprenol N-acetylglucosamine transferase